MHGGGLGLSACLPPTRQLSGQGGYVPWDDSQCIWKQWGEIVWTASRECKDLAAGRESLEYHVSERLWMQGRNDNECRPPQSPLWGSGKRLQ